MGTWTEQKAAATLTQLLLRAFRSPSAPATCLVLTSFSLSFATYAVRPPPLLPLVVPGIFVLLASVFLLLPRCPSASSLCVLTDWYRVSTHPDDCSVVLNGTQRMAYKFSLSARAVVSFLR